MNTLAIAVVLIRLFGFSFCLEGLMVLTYLPTNLFAVGLHSSITALREFDAVMQVIRSLLYWAVGLIMISLAKRLARLFTRGLPVSPDEPHSPSVWPPPPNKPAP